MPRPTATFWLCMILLLGSGCEHRAATPVSMEAVRAEAGPDQESWQAHLYISEDGRPRIQILAGHLAKYNREDSTFMLLTGSLTDSLDGQVTVYLYDALGDSSAVMTANRVFYYDTERRFEARGAVVVNTAEGKRLETEHLLWLEAERRVETTGFVRLTDPPDLIEGFDLSADEDLENYELQRVTGTTTIVEDP